MAERVRGGQSVLGLNRLVATIVTPRERAKPGCASRGGRAGIALERTLRHLPWLPGRREVAVGYDVQQTGAPVHLELSVLNEAGETLARREAGQEIMDVLGMRVSRRLLPPGQRTLTVRGVLQLSEGYLERARLILAVFDPEMVLEARQVVVPRDRVLRAQIELPPLETGPHSLHVVLKSGEGDDAQRIAEEKVILEVRHPSD